MIVNATTCGAHKPSGLVKPFPKNIKDIYNTFVNVLSWATIEFISFLQYFLAISQKFKMAIKINNLFLKKNVGHEKKIGPERIFVTEINFVSE